MFELGFKYIKIFSKTFHHPFITLKQGYRQLSYDRAIYSTRILDFLNIDVKVNGDVPKQNHLLYVINHRSLLDIMIMESIFLENTKNGIWLAKDNLFEAIYGKFFLYSGSIGVDIEEGKGLLKFFKTIKNTLKKVDDLNIYIFPEGERYSGDGITKFQAGAAKIAKSNKLGVVNVYIKDTLETVLKNAPYKNKMTVEVHFDGISSNVDLEKNYNIFMTKVKNG